MNAYDAGHSRAARAYEWDEDTWAASDKRPALVARIRETEHPMLSILLRLP